MLIHGANGPLVQFGGDEAFKSWRKGDVCASLQWLNIGHESGEPQPCLCLYPVNRRDNGGAYVVPQDNAHAYATNTGNPTRFLMGAAFKATVTMGFFPDKQTVYRVIDVIIDAIPDLIRMPSASRALLERRKEPVKGVEVTVKHGDKVIGEHVI